MVALNQLIMHHNSQMEIEFITSRGSVVDVACELRRVTAHVTLDAMLHTKDGKFNYNCRSRGYDCAYLCIDV